MAEIMEVAKGGRLKTQIMYGVNLSFSQLKEYLSFMTKIGFLRVREENRKKVYGTTVKGIQYIESYREMANLLKKPNLVEAPIAQI
jgi:predicted transcriptional regulator